MYLGTHCSVLSINLSFFSYWIYTYVYTNFYIKSDEAYVYEKIADYKLRKSWHLNTLRLFLLLLVLLYYFQTQIYTIWDTLKLEFFWEFLFLVFTIFLLYSFYQILWYSHLKFHPLNHLIQNQQCLLILHGAEMYIPFLILFLINQIFFNGSICLRSLYINLFFWI